MTERTIGELVLSAGQNNQLAINELYNQTVHKAHFVAKRILNDEDQAADIVQESYVKAFSSLRTLADPERFQGWLDTIVINKCRDYLRKKKPLLFSQLEDEDGNIPLEFEDTTVEFSPEAAVDYSETKRLIGEMIDALAEDQKMCLLMFHYEEKSLNEIAEIMGCPVNTVKSRLGYARKSLKNQVLELEKKGTKLYCLPLAPFLYWFFRQSLLDTLAGSTVGAVSGIAGAAATAAVGTSAGATANAAVEASAKTATAEMSVGAAPAATAGVSSTSSAVAGKAAIFGVKKFLMIAAVTATVAVSGNKVYQTVVMTPEHTIHQFERAYNNWDVDKMVQCMSPEIQQQYRSIRGLIGIFGLDPSDLFAAAVGIGNWSGSDISNVTIDIVDLSYVDKTHAQAQVKITMGNNVGDSDYAHFVLQKIDGKWYIME